MDMGELAGNEKDPGTVKLEGGGALALLLVKISTRGRSPRDCKPKKNRTNCWTPQICCYCTNQTLDRYTGKSSLNSGRKHEQEELARKGKKKKR
jgi:hypothetical protein